MLHHNGDAAASPLSCAGQPCVVCRTEDQTGSRGGAGIHMKNKYVKIGLIAAAVLLTMAFAVWIGMQLGARSRVSEETGSVNASAGAMDSIPESAGEDSALSVADPEVIPDTSVAEESLSEEAPPLEPLTKHVTGIRDFSIIEGMAPDVMAGVLWDNFVVDVAADVSGCDFGIPGVYELPYTISGADGRHETATIHVTVRHDLEQFLYGMEGAVYVSVGDTFDPMENVVYDEEIASVEPDMNALDTSKEGEYLISYHLTGTDGVKQTAVRRIHVGEEPTIQVPGQVQTDVGEYSTVTDLGLWRLTAYMDTPEDQGPYVGQTASGAPLVAGRTVAVSQATCERLGLVFGDRLMVDGYVYILEDYGGSAMYNSDWLDIFVDNEIDEYSEQYNRYAEVYLLR